MPFRHGKTYHWAAPTQEYIDGATSYLLDTQWKSFSIIDGAEDTWDIVKKYL
jgi:hypothetical protein